MGIKDANKTTSDNPKTIATYNRLEQLLQELRTHNLPGEVIDDINKQIDGINNWVGNEKKQIQQYTSALRKIIGILEKKLKIVPKKYYQNLWTPIGMSAYGLPLGVVFGLSLNNMAFLGIGLPFGLVIGIAVGVGMDKKAAREGRQLNFQL